MRRDDQKAVVHSARQQCNDKRYIRYEYRFEYFWEGSPQASRTEQSDDSKESKESKDSIHSGNTTSFQNNTPVFVLSDRICLKERSTSIVEDIFMVDNEILLVSRLSVVDVDCSTSRLYASAG
jgi:hypothetical protein